MKNKDLIKILSNLPEDMEVILWSSEEGNKKIEFVDDETTFYDEDEFEYKKAICLH